MSTIKTDYLQINISKANGDIHNFKGQFVGLDYLKWTNKDIVLLANRIVEFKDFSDQDAEATPVDLSGILSLRLTGKTELSSAGTTLFNVDLFNEGDRPELEDLVNGLVTKKISLNHTALDTLLDGENSVEFIIQYSGQDSAGNPFTFPAEGMTVKLYEGADQDDAPNNPEPPTTYLTTNEVLRIVGGVADIVELTAIPEAELFNRQKTFVESEELDYWYDEDAASGDHAPDDQTLSTGFWKKKGNKSIKDNLTAVTAPGATNDETEGYSKKSKWIDNSQSPIEAYECADPTEDNAVWLKTTLTVDELAAVALSGNKADVGLGNVNNTSDADKPVSTAQQTAIDAKQDALSGASLTAETIALLDKLIYQDDSDSDNIKTGTPQEILNLLSALAQNLDVAGFKIISSSDGDIDIEPNGTGNVLLGNLKFDADQAIGAGQDDFVLTYDHATGLISLEASAGGGGAGNFPPTTDTSDKTGAYTVLSGDVGKNVVIGAAASADFDITMDVSLLSSQSDVIGFVNESDYIARVVVSNTGTMTINSQKTDIYVSPSQNLYLGGDTSTNCRILSQVG